MVNIDKEIYTEIIKRFWPKQNYRLGSKRALPPLCPHLTLRTYMRKGLWGPQSRHCRGETRYLRQTFVGGPGLGTGRGCWRRAAVWAGTCFLSFRKVVSGAGHPLVLRHLSAKRTRVRGSEWTRVLFPNCFCFPQMPEQRNRDKERTAGSFVHLFIHSLT